MFPINSKEELIKFLNSETVDTSEAIKLLNCTRQNLDDLIKRGKLTPIRVFSKTKIFLKEDILARLK